MSEVDMALMAQRDIEAFSVPDDAGAGRHVFAVVRQAPEIARKLAAYGPSVAVHLMRRFSGFTYYQRLAVMRALGALASKHADPAALELLMAHTESSDLDTRVAAIDALGDSRLPEATEVIRPLISDEDPLVIAAVTRALLRIAGSVSGNGQDGVELPQSESAQLQLAATLDSRAAQGPDRGIVYALLRSPFSSVRREVLEQQLDDESTPAQLLQEIIDDDEDAGVRRSAAAVLSRHHKDKELIPLFVELLENADRDVSKTAGAWLKRHRKELREELFALLSHPRAHVREEVFLLLRDATEDPRLRQHLLELLNGRIRKQFRTRIMNTLKRMPFDEDIRRALDEALYADAEGVHKVALEGLEAGATDEALRSVARAAARHIIHGKVADCFAVLARQPLDRAAAALDAIAD